MADDAIEKASTYPVEYYWFEGRGRGRVARFWPNTSSRRIRQSANLDSFSGAILSTDYGENFLNMRNKGKVYKNFETILSRKAFKSGVNPDFMPYLRLASNGYTSNRLLGKEQDKNLNLAGVRILKEKGLENVDFAGDVRAWADMATSEGRLNPAAFLKMITAERLVNDKALLANLHTVDELKKAGYEIPEFAEPVMITKKGEELYDLSSVYSTTARVTPSYALLGDKEINANSFKDLNNIENMSGFIQSLSKATGVKIVASDGLEQGQTSFKLGRIRNIGRRLISFLSTSSNGLARAVPYGVVTYSSKGTPAEQVYSIVKQVSELTCEQPITKTIKLIQKKSPSNLPNLSDFENNKEIVKSISASLIASQMISMANLSVNDAKILQELFKIDAAQTLSRVSNPYNEWMMPLIASYVTNSSKAFANEFGIENKLSEYAKILGVEPSTIGSTNSVILGMRDLSVENKGLITSVLPDEKLDENLFIDIEETKLEPASEEKEEGFDEHEKTDEEEREYKEEHPHEEKGSKIFDWGSLAPTTRTIYTNKKCAKFKEKSYALMEEVLKSEHMNLNVQHIRYKKASENMKYSEKKRAQYKKQADELLARKTELLEIERAFRNCINQEGLKKVNDDIAKAEDKNIMAKREALAGKFLMNKVLKIGLLGLKYAQGEPVTYGSVSFKMDAEKAKHMNASAIFDDFIKNCTYHDLKIDKKSEETSVKVKTVSGKTSIKDMLLNLYVRPSIDKVLEPTKEFAVDEYEYEKVM